MHDSLDYPDLPRWRALPDYSAEMAVRLRSAYQLIRRGGGLTASFLRGLWEVERTWGQRMAAPQRLRACYVLAMAYLAVNANDLAFSWIEHGIELAHRQDDLGALSRLLYLRGTLGFSDLEWAEASEDFAESRVYLRAVSDGGPAHDSAQELQLVIQEANVRAFMGHLDHALALLDLARTLFGSLPGHVLEGATINWIQANILRWQGFPARALPLALSAANIYTSLGAANSTARIQVAAAEIALDLAAAFPAGAERYNLLNVAQPHVSLAKLAAVRADRETGGDPAGRALMRLTEVRYQRLSGANTDRVETVEEVAHEAHRLDDHALLAQSFTSLADELVSLREYGSAAATYREALGVLDGSDLRSLTVWPWRGLARLDHLSV